MAVWQLQRHGFRRAGLPQQLLQQRRRNAACGQSGTSELLPLWRRRRMVRRSCNKNGTGDVIIPGAGFSAPIVSGSKADPSGSTWSFTGTAGIVANGSTLNNPASTSGTQAAYLQGGGSFTEKVTFSGGLADLTFSDATTGSESVAIYVDGVRLSGLTTPGSAYTAQRTAVFNTGAAGSTHT